jgi:hypothetical protein
MKDMKDMGDLMDEYEAEREARAKVEMAAEKAAWDALPQAEKDRINAQRQAKFAALMDFDPEADDEEEEDDEEEDDEEDDEEEEEE